MSSGKSSDYREKEDGDMERVVWEGMDVLGASVSKMTILKMVSVATDQKVLKIVDSVDEAIDNLIGKGLVCKQNGKYQIVNNKGILRFLYLTVKKIYDTFFTEILNHFVEEGASELKKIGV